MNSSESTPAVAGLCNLGNTCYLNAALQALASSRQFITCIATLSGAFESTAEPEQEQQPSLAQQLTAAVKFVLEGPADERPLSHAQLTAQAAQGHLTRALHKLLTALQPQQQQQQHAVRAVHPGEVLSRLSWYVPAGVLEPGLQQDAAEALELLCDAVGTELTCWHQVHERTWQQQQQGAAVGLKALLQETCSYQRVSHPQAHQQQEQQQWHEQQRACANSVHCHKVHANGKPSDQQLQFVKQQTHQQRQPRQQQQQQQQQLQDVPQRLPVVGYTVDEITCTACGDRFPCSITPFMVLPLSLPHTPLGTVPPGTTLHHCLARYSQSELLQGVECMRCSLRASLQPLDVQLQQHLRQTQEKQRKQEQQQQQQEQEQEQGDQGKVRCDCQQQQQHQQQGEEVQGSTVKQQPPSSPPPPPPQQQQQQRQGDEDAGAAQGVPVQQVITTQQEQQQGVAVLAMLHSLCEAQQPLPPLDYSRLLQQQQQQQQQQLTWTPKKRSVFKRTVLGRPPPVLLLQLQRAAHFAWHGAKIQGHVQFPLVLNWSVCQADHQQEQPQEQRLQDGQQQQQVQPAEVQQQDDQQQILYDLVAVVQHLGSGHSWGHYIMYRRVQQQLPIPTPALAAAAAAAAEALAAAGQNGEAVYMNGCQGRMRHSQPHQHNDEGSIPRIQGVQQCNAHNSSSGSSSKSRCCWLRVSDSSVATVSEQEVLRCQATLLVYEKRE